MTGEFKLTITVCKHPDPSERIQYAIDDPPSHYHCGLCGSNFPMIGNTALWADGLKARIEPL